MEYWEAVVGYEGRYEVSNLGRVRSLPRTVANGSASGRRVEGRILKPGGHEGGYQHVMLSKDGVAKPVRIHVMVLEAFVGPRPGSGFEVHGCHRDGDPLNNKLGNLRWAPVAENHADKLAHGTSSRGERNGASSMSESQARSIKQQVSNRIRGDIPRIAREMNVGIAAVRAIAVGRTWRHI